MRFDRKFHLTYCTNIHPGQDWKTTWSALASYVPEIKKAVCDSRPFGLGLRLSNKASEELGRGKELIRFKEWLDSKDLYVFTMNGFPYGNFHDEAVKEKVHVPDWTTKDRLNYTKRLFDQLAVLLPEEVSGGISTSPIGYKHWYPEKNQKTEAFKTAAEHMLQMVFHLHSLEETTGRYMHLDIEPEPDGLLENSEEVVYFFKEYLLPTAMSGLAKELGLPNGQTKEIVLKYITVCYDICHFSLAYEKPAHTFSLLAEHGIRIGKIQVSAALKIRFEGQDTELIWESLSRFNEPVYLHQVTENRPDGVRTFPDLPEVLYSKETFTELRAHYHVPIFLKEFPPLYSTQDQILEVLAILKKNTICEHLEVETYTWEVLPADLKKDLSTSIIRELNWLTEKLTNHE